MNQCNTQLSDEEKAAAFNVLYKIIDDFDGSEESADAAEKKLEQLEKTVTAWTNTD